MLFPDALLLLVVVYAATTKHNRCCDYKSKQLRLRHPALFVLASTVDLWIIKTGQDEVFSGVLLAIDLNGLRPGHLPVALDQRDPPGLDQSLQTLVEATDHAVAVLVDLRHVDALECCAHPEGFGFPGRIGHLRRVQQSLGRDAPAMQAGATEFVGVDEDDGLTEFCCSQGTGVAAAAPSEALLLPAAAVPAPVSTQAMPPSARGRGRSPKTATPAIMATTGSR